MSHPPSDSHRPWPDLDALKRDPRPQPLALPTVASVAVSLPDLTEGLKRWTAAMRKAVEAQNAFAAGVGGLLARVRAGRRWARGPRRGASMRRRAIYLQARRP